MGCPLSGDKGFRRLGQRQLAQRMFDDDLPKRNNAEEHLVLRILDRRSGFFRQGRVTGDEPEEIAGIEQNVHPPSKSRST